MNKQTKYVPCQRLVFVRSGAGSSVGRTTQSRYRSQKLPHQIFDLFLHLRCGLPGVIVLAIALPSDAVLLACAGATLADDLLRPELVANVALERYVSVFVAIRGTDRLGVVRTKVQTAPPQLEADHLVRRVSDSEFTI